jgi:hypothetical protein
MERKRTLSVTYRVQVDYSELKFDPSGASAEWEDCGEEFGTLNAAQEHLYAVLKTATQARIIERTDRLVPR